MDSDGDTEKLSELRIVLMGSRGAGKSSTGNIILNREEFDLKRTAQCVKRQREVADRHITVIEAPGWWIDVPVDQSSELLKQEILLSVSLCPPGPHVVLLLVIRVDIRFKEDERKVFQGYVDLLGERVWSHTIVLFTHGDFLGDTSIEQHIEREGEDLQWLVEKCGNRYHVLNNKNRRDDTQIKDLLEKIEETVTQNNGCHFELLQQVKEKRREEEKRAESQMMSEDEMSDTVSLRSSGYGSFRSRSGADNSSVFASSNSKELPPSFAGGSYNKRLQQPLRSEDQMSDSVSGSSGYSSFRSRSSDKSLMFASTRYRDFPVLFAGGSYNKNIQQPFMTEDEMSDTVSLRSSAYGSFRSRSVAKNFSMFASLCSRDFPVLFAGGSYNKKLQKPLRSEDEMSDSVFLRCSGYSSFRSRSGDNSSIFDSKDEPPNFADGSVPSTPQSVEHSQIKKTKNKFKIFKLLRGKQKKYIFVPKKINK